MNSLKVINLTFSGIVNPKAQTRIYEKLNSFSYEFSFGKSFLLDSEMGGGGWALSWIIAGMVKPETGTILLDDIKRSARDLRREIWCVRRSEIKKFGLFGNQQVSAQIRHGLKTVQEQYLPSEDEIIQRFRLTKERYNRSHRALSSEGWSASCAIGLANGKKIFCFPHMEERFVNEYYDLWLKEMVELLTDAGSLVLFPSKATDNSKSLCDLIITV